MKNQAPHRDFASFSFSSTIYSAVKAAGYKEPTDVQIETIPAILEGKDVLARAETGSGKTAAFVLPILEKILRQRSASKGKRRGNVVDCIVLVPTRELAIQIREEFEKFSSEFEENVKCLSVYGGVKINPQMLALRGGAEVLISTPGRLIDLSKQNAILLHQVRTLVVDEVDRLMKGDFEEEIDSIFKLMPKTRQNLMFTATFPDSIRKLVRKIMNEPEIINVDDLYDDVTINQRVFTVNHDKKNDLLAALLKENDWKQVLVFCSAKRSCDNVVKKLEKRDISAVAMHGNLQQNARARALSDFKAGKIRVLIATDVAGRGIDIDQLPCVINYELPRSPNDYTHRIGRTGRAGEAGTAISLISHGDYQHFKVIEKRNRVRLEREQYEGLEADDKAPEAPKRSKPKKKAKGKKRNVLVKKKDAISKEKQEARDLEVKAASKAKKEKFAEKARAKRKAEKEDRTNESSPYSNSTPKEPSTSSYYNAPVKTVDKSTTGKPKSEQVMFDEKPSASSNVTTKQVKTEVASKTAKPITPETGASLYTRKLPKTDDK